MSKLAASILRALSNLRQNWLISSITVGIISVCLFLVGGYLLLTHNLKQAVETFKTEVRLTVYLRDGFPQKDIDAFQDRMASMPEVHSVAFISKDQALEDLGAMLAGNQNLLEGLESNPLPASLRIIPSPEYRSIEGVNSILAAIGDDPLVEEIVYGKEWLDRLDKVLAILELGSIALGLALSLAAVFIISNTIKITVMARKDELEIMRLVGATEGFIRVPFLVEGILQGVAGAVLSLALLFGLFQILVQRTGPALLSTFRLDTLSFLPHPLIGLILLGGMVIGGLGSLASVGRHSR